MAPSSPRLRILSVGGNAVSAFLSWRLQATNACDVTLVWKSGFESVAQYGISFRSARFGNERFKPRQVVRTPEEAAQIPSKGSYDYVLLCVKALPDIYDLASVIESVVTPQHTCILINTSHSLGVEAAIEKRYPKNVVLSLVSHADVQQIGPAEFEHSGATDLWVGPANWNSEIPVSIQSDMAEALAMTLGSGHVECKVSKNIQQQQFERMIGPVAFHTTSVLFETPNHADLLVLTGVRTLISETIGEMVSIAEARGCTFPQDFRERTMEEMITPKDSQSIMYQDYAAKRPMEIETYLGSPLKIARDVNVKTPRIETLYALLHHVNTANQKRPATQTVENATVTPHQPPMQRMSSAPPMNGARGPFPTNGMHPPNGNHPPNGMYSQNGMQQRGSRAPSMTGPHPGPMRRGPPPPGYGPGPNGMMPPRGPGQMQRRPSFEQPSGLDEFSHLVMYDTPADSYEGGAGSYGGENSSPNAMVLREREYMLRQKELALRERELAMRGGRGGPGPRPPMRGHTGSRGPPRPPPSHFDEDDEDGDDYFDPMAYRGPPVDPDQVDMMSITSRRNRNQPSVSQLRQNPEMGGPRRGNHPFSSGGPMSRNRTSSARTMIDHANTNENLHDNPLFALTDNRYGAVDRKELGTQSRTNSLTAARLDELQQGNYGPYPPSSRRSSQSPGNALGPPQGRGPLPGRGGYAPNGINGMSPNGASPNGRPSPPDMRQPVPRHPPGHGNSVAPQAVEQRAGVSTLYPPKSGPQVDKRSTTGSASATNSANSAGSNESGRSVEVSAYSSQSSLGHRAPMGIRS